MDSDENAGEADEEGENPQHERELFVEGKDDCGDSGGDESVIGWEAVVWSVRNEGDEIPDDEWTRIVVEHASDFCGDVDCRQGDDRKERHVFLNLARLFEEEYSGDEHNNEHEIFCTEDEKEIHSLRQEYTKKTTLASCLFWWTWRELNPRLPNPTFPIASTRSSAKYGITIKRNKSRYDDFAATGQPL